MNGTKYGSPAYTLVTCEAAPMVTGKHSFEVEIVGAVLPTLHVGVVHTGAFSMSERKGRAFADPSTLSGYFMRISDGSLVGYHKCHSDKAGGLMKGDRLRVVVDRNEGSVRFFKNDQPHGPDYEVLTFLAKEEEAVVPAVQLCYKGEAERLL